MQKQHHVIFIPGLGDYKRGFEPFVYSWKILGIVPHIHRMGWHDGVPFVPKLKNLVAVIDSFLEKDCIVSLIGSSAGGSAVLNALLLQPKINAVVNICGRLRAGKNVFPSLDIAAKTSLSFKESVITFEENEKKMNDQLRGKVLNVDPVWDEIVPKSTMFLSGAESLTIPSFEHIFSGFLGITLFAPRIINFIKQKAL